MRQPKDTLSRIRSIFKPSMNDLAGIFGVTRQTVYNWAAGERPTLENIQRIDDLAKAAEIFEAHGYNAPHLFRRKLLSGMTIGDIVREGGDVVGATARIIEIAQEEGAARRSATRTSLSGPGAIDLFDLGVATLNEES